MVHARSVRRQGREWMRTLAPGGLVSVVALVAGCTAQPMREESKVTPAEDSTQAERTGEAQDPWTRAHCAALLRVCVLACETVRFRDPCRSACEVGYVECMAAATD